MKKLLVVFGFAAASVFAADVTGFVMDKKCSANKAMVGNEACAKRCIGGGAEAVLATEDGKIYTIENQDKIKEHAGHKVTITGKVEGDKITVESVKM
jgi:nitrite reductase/ring-hydroxylating ferredoxin subunit